MAVSNRDRVGRALELLRAGLHPFVDPTMRARKGAAWAQEFSQRGQLRPPGDGSIHLDTPVLLRAIDRYWGEVFSEVLDRAQRSLVNELIDTRNKWAHDYSFNSADTERALDSAKRLLEAVSAREQAEEVGRAYYEVRRAVFEEEARNKTLSENLERRRAEEEAAIRAKRAPAAERKRTADDTLRVHLHVEATQNLSKKFDTAMFDIYRRAKSEAGYNATIFLGMLNDRGGLSTAKYLINAPKPSDGYTNLYERGRLDLTVEAMIVENPKWHSLFTPEEVDKARRRLRQYNYNPKA
jgi:hypothetical protein